VLIAGIDEAGRGAVLGPLVVAGVVISEDKINRFKNIGVKDSKLLTKKRRSEIYSKILSYSTTYVRMVPPSKISGRNLNCIEKEVFSEVIKDACCDKIYIDAFDTNIDRLYRELSSITDAELFIEHKADLKYPVVSAASIVAKVVRDKEIMKLSMNSKIPLGSGYPSDPLTLNFLKYCRDRKNFPEFVRLSWKTVKRLMYSQTKLDNII